MPAWPRPAIASRTPTAPPVPGRPPPPRATPAPATSRAPPRRAAAARPAGPCRLDRAVDQRVGHALRARSASGRQLAVLHGGANPLAELREDLLDGRRRRLPLPAADRLHAQADRPPRPSRRRSRRSPPAAGPAAAPASSRPRPAGRCRPGRVSIAQQRACESCTRRAWAQMRSKRDKMWRGGHGGTHD